MIRRLVAAALATTVALGLVGCGTPNAGGPVVAVTTNILGDVVTQLVGDQAEVLVLMPAGADPHSFTISAQEAARLERADLLLVNGLGLEEGVQSHVDAAISRGTPVVAAGDLIAPLDFVDPDRGAVRDPHLWNDPRLMRDVVAGFARALGDHVDGLDPDLLASAVSDYDAELVALDAELAESFAELPAERRRLITDHHVFGYLAARYDFEVLGAVVPSGTTLAAPSARDLDELASTIREAGVPAIFVDSAQSDRLSQVLASEAGVDVEVVTLHAESLSAPGEPAGTYLGLMRSNAEAIVVALSRLI